MLESFISQWGYLAIVLGTFAEGEAVVLAAGAMAHRGLLSLPEVVLAATLGTLCSDQLWFQLGRRLGRRFVERRPKLASRVHVIEGWLQRFGTLFVVGFRFLYGARTASPIVLGLSHYPTPRFMILNAVGAVLWASVFSALGFGLGAGVRAMFGHSLRVEEALLIAAVLGVALWLLGRRART